MTINPPMVSAGPTVTRAETKAVAGKVVNAVPPEHYYRPRTEFDPPGYGPVEEPQAPVTEGLLRFYREDGTNVVSGYVVVRADDILTWKPVVLRLVNPYTGEDYDALAGFYNPLAS